MGILHQLDGPGEGEAALAELTHGARSETIAATRAELSRTQVELNNAQRERARAGDLRSKGLNGQGELDRADTTMRCGRG